MEMKTTALRLRHAAFTLVETVLAIALLSVALLGISSVLVTALSTSGANDRDTLMVSMSEHILAELKLVPFDALGAAAPLDEPSPSPLLLTSSQLQDSVYYFNSDGQQIAADRVQADGAYRCTVKKASLPTESGAAAAGQRCEMLRLTLLFQTPVAAPETPLTVRTLTVRLARR